MNGYCDVIAVQCLGQFGISFTMLVFGPLSKNIENI